MHVTVTTLSDEISVFDVSPDLDLASLKGLCAIEFHVPASQISLVLNGLPLDNDIKKLKDYKIADGDVLLMQRIQGEKGLTHAQQMRQGASSSGTSAPFIDFGSISIPGVASNRNNASFTPSSELEDPAVLREIILNSPHDLALLRERNPPLSEALLCGDLTRFTQVLRQQQRERQVREQEKLQLLNSDPFDSDAQRRIAEEIRLKNVEHNMETAMEYAPESFGQVSMLYIDCMVNHHPVKAFVDSGAQTTIMSQACAERCNIMRLADTRFTGVAKGVGVQAIIGKVHLCQLQIGSAFLQCSFCILKDQPMDMLLGLDMLKRHQCIIDLKANELIIGSSGTRTPFLGEADLPPHARLNKSHNEDDHDLLEAVSRSKTDTSNNNNNNNGNNNKDNSSGEAKAGHSRQEGHSSMEVDCGDSTSEATATTSQQKHRPTSAALGTSFPELSIRQITDHGFSREQAVDELEKSGGNVDEALASLLTKFFQS